MIESAKINKINNIALPYSAGKLIQFKNLVPHNTEIKRGLKAGFVSCIPKIIREATSSQDYRGIVVLYAIGWKRNNVAHTRLVLSKVFRRIRNAGPFLKYKI